MTPHTPPIYEHNPFRQPPAFLSPALFLGDAEASDTLMAQAISVRHLSALPPPDAVHESLDDHERMRLLGGSSPLIDQPTKLRPFPHENSWHPNDCPPSSAVSQSAHVRRLRRDGKLVIRPVTLSESSSPQSTFSTFSLSQGDFTSGRSTPWSRNTSTAGNPSPSPVQFLASAQPRMQVASLLTDPQSRSYHLEVVQHPQRTAEFGEASLSRLPLAPPIIAQLTVRDRAGHSVIPEMELPFLIAHLSLFTEDGSTPLDMSDAPSGTAPPHAEPRRLLYGNLVSSPQKLRDLQGRQGIFFLFSDVSIRWHGSFQLGITLMRLSRIDSTGAMSMDDHGTILAQARTRPFDVLSHQNYVAPPQTRLTQCFLRQGARMYISTPVNSNPH